MSVPPLDCPHLGTPTPHAGVYGCKLHGNCGPTFGVECPSGFVSAKRLSLVHGGPGTELKAILHALNIHPVLNCKCHEDARRMDEWGVEGCRANRATIMSWLEEKYRDWGWTKRILVVAKAATTGLALRLSVTDPVGSLVDEAIRRAEANA